MRAMEKLKNRLRGFKYRVPLFRITWTRDKNGKVKITDAYAPIVRGAKNIKKYVKGKIHSLRGKRGSKSN